MEESPWEAGCVGSARPSRGLGQWVLAAAPGLSETQDRPPSMGARPHSLSGPWESAILSVLGKQVTDSYHSPSLGANDKGLLFHSTGSVMAKTEAGLGLRALPKGQGASKLEMSSGGSKTDGRQSKETAVTATT